MITLTPCSLFAIFSLLLGITAAQTSSQVYNYHQCSGAADTFEGSSVFATNLDKLLSTLSALDHTNKGFYNLSVGNHADQVNSFALCRGDVVSESSCLDCIKFAASDLPRRCPAQRDAVVWYDNCMLRYTTWYLFGSLRRSFATVPYGSHSPDAGLYMDRLFTLLKALRDTASLGGSYLKFAVGDTEFSGSKRIYALVQCLPNLDQMQCANCVVHSLRDINRLIPGMEGGSVFGGSCNIKFDTKQFYGDAVAELPLLPHQGRQKRNIIIVVSVLVVISMILLTCFWLWWIKREVKPAGNGDEVKSLELQVQFETIRAATSDFSDENKLGQGVFGAVYKGKLMDGQEIAVKRLAQNSSQGAAEFKNEVMLLAKLQHKNLVKLLGFCLQGQERLLIYEYVRNASLDKFLFDPFKRASLNWETRYKIIKGIAKGLLYLHEDSRLRVIHRDLKTGNVLLDDYLNPKIADFGMARLFSMDQTHSETIRIVGTYGYMPPEYAIHGQFSTKSDVYSFGVVIMELITGHKISSFTVNGASENLLSFAWDSWRAGKVSDICDPALMDGPRDEILRSIHIGLLCVQESVKARPTMASVFAMLSGITLSMPLPSRPAYFTSNTISSSLDTRNSIAKFDVDNEASTDPNTIDPRVKLTPRVISRVKELAVLISRFRIHLKLARGECFGRITIEAMAFHLPVLGTAAGGTTEIVVNGSTGLLHPVGKMGVTPLAKNMIKLATHVEQRLTMGRRGYESVKEMFLEVHMAQRISTVFGDVLRKSKSH